MCSTQNIIPKKNMEKLERLEKIADQLQSSVHICIRKIDEIQNNGGLKALASIVKKED